MDSLKFAGGTDRGKVRKENEDSILYCDFENSDVILLVVADGVGGYAGGSVASKLAVSSIKETIGKAVLLAHSGGGYAENWLELTLYQAIIEANQHIRSEQLLQSEFSEMSTTVVAMLCHQQQLAISYLGDSRCYCLSENDFNQITEDHTMLQVMLNEGKITQQEFDTIPLHHMISQAIGLTDTPDVIVAKYEFKPESIYLLCSDGLTNCVSDAQIQHVLTENKSLESCVDELITRANDNGGKDNISAVIVARE